MNSKKLSFLFTFVLLASLLLSACANNTADDGLGTNTATVENEIPETGPEEDLVTEEPLPTETPVVAEEPVMETPTEEVVEPTLEETNDMAEGDAFQCKPQLLSNILDYNIYTADGVLLGEVDGLVVLHAANEVYGLDDGFFDDGFDFDETETATIAVPTSAPAPVIGYVIADLDDAALADLNLENGDMLLPFSAFQPMTAMNDDMLLDDDDTGDVGDSDTVEDTDEAGDDDMADDSDAMAAADECALSLTLAGADLANAPILENDNWDFTAEDWNTNVNSFATELGLVVPTLSADAAANKVVFDDGIFDQVDVDVNNFDDESLGEFDEFIVNAQDGTFRYGVLQTDAFLGIGQETVLVPVSHMIWVNADDDLGDLGEIFIPVAEGAFEGAPDYDPDTIDFTDDTWDDEWEGFWANLSLE